MAIKWARKETMTREEALKEILAISDYTQKKYGEYRDIDLTDTLNWIGDSLHFQTQLYLKMLHLKLFCGNKKAGSSSSP